MVTCNQNVCQAAVAPESRPRAEFRVLYVAS